MVFAAYQVDFTLSTSDCRVNPSAIDKASLGVFSKLAKKPAEQVLRENDRVEIYRPLIADPKKARANRAAKQKKA